MALRAFWDGHYLVFEWLFKYPAEWFARGDIQLAWSIPQWIAASIGLTLVAYLLLNFVGIRRALLGPKHAILWILRGLLLSTLLFVMLYPELVTEVDESVPGEITVFIDQSKSMSITDTPGENSRLDAALALFDPADGQLTDQLNADFNPRYLSFGRSVTALTPSSDVNPSDGRSDLVSALRSLVSAGVNDAPTAAIVISDGGIDNFEGLSDTIDQLKARGIKLHTVSVGNPTPQPDIELNRVTGPTRVLRGDSVALDLTIKHTDMAGRTTDVVLEEDGAILAKQTLTIPADSDTSRVRFQLPLDVPGVRRLRLSVPAQDGETQTKNNALETTVVVRDEPINVLHFEGEPRFEVKFARRALGDDDAIRLASLIRTAENKYYRLGILDPSELAEGFPTTEEQLFAYDVLVLGSVDAELLDDERQRLVQRFVSERGGGLLLLGASGAFARGGFAGQPLAAVMPVTLPKTASAFKRDLTVQPTAAGLRHPLLQIARNEPLTELWNRLPPLTIINPVSQAKPAATVLLKATADDDDLIIMAEQPYGRGHVVALATRNTWRWQMDSQLPEDDPTHELLWRQMIRWLARDVTTRLMVNPSHSIAVQSDTVTLAIEAYDKTYNPDDAAQVTVNLTDPSGSIIPVRAVQDATPGRFTAQFTANEVGYYEVETTLKTTTAGTDEDVMQTLSGVQVSAEGSEFIDTQTNEAVMQTLASQTGGQSHTLATANNLTDILKSSLSTRSSLQRLALWNAPAWLILLLLIASIEWLLRRRWFAA